MLTRRGLRQLSRHARGHPLAVVDVPVVNRRGVDERDLQRFVSDAQHAADHPAGEGVVDGIRPADGAGRPSVRDDETGLLARLADGCLSRRLSRVDPAAGHRPSPVVSAANEQHSAFRIDDERVGPFSHRAIVRDGDQRPIAYATRTGVMQQ